jgi:polyisoprenoid-binding protein YceI
MKKIIMAFVAVLGLFCAQAQSLVPSESKVAFVIKNLGIGVDGSFTGLGGVIKFDPKNLAGSSFDVTVDANTINTANKMRDDHLRKDEYFGVATYKTIRLKSNKITSKGGNNYNFAGVITIKDKSFNISFDFTATPGTTGYLFASSFSINRKKFGVGGNSATLADLVKVNLKIKSK